MGGEPDAILKGRRPKSPELSRLKHGVEPEFYRETTRWSICRPGFINPGRETRRRLRREVPSNWLANHAHPQSGAAGPTPTSHDTLKSFAENGGQTAFNQIGDVDNAKRTSRWRCSPGRAPASAGSERATHPGSTVEPGQHRRRQRRAPATYVALREHGGLTRQPALAGLNPTVSTAGRVWGLAGMPCSCSSTPARRHSRSRRPWLDPRK